MNTKQTTSIRIDSVVLDRVREEARLSNRSFSNFVETLFVRLGYGNSEALAGKEYTKEEMKAMIQKARKESEEGKLTTISDIDNIWESII